MIDKARNQMSAARGIERFLASDRALSGAHRAIDAKRYDDALAGRTDQGACYWTRCIAGTWSQVMTASRRNARRARSARSRIATCCGSGGQPW